MRQLVALARHDLVDIKRIKFHTNGTYKPDYPYTDYLDAAWGHFKPKNPWEDENSYNNGVQYSKCGLRMNVNPFGIGKNNIRVPDFIYMRRDHAERFAEPCKKCFPSK